MTTRLRRLLERPEIGFLMESHNGLSAKIASEAGFEAIWASGLSMSAALGVRDNNEATWTQLLEVIEFMTDASDVPILIDGDTGYGDFNILRRVIRKLESRGVAGICIEDKIFPKTNSFINGHSQPLAPIDEFCGKIRAGVASRSDPDFVVVARVEAFIAGWGLDEALRRASAYHDAGADAILMHSALRKPDEVFAFLDRWENRCPVVLVPTKYYTTPTDEFARRGASAVIWANHLLRSSIAAMQRTAETIHQDRSLMSVEDRIVPVAEVFRLQGAAELAEAERRFLPAAVKRTSAVIFAFDRGDEMGSATVDRPKAMVHVAGKPILRQAVADFRGAGVAQIEVIRGYQKNAVDLDNVVYRDTDITGDRREIEALAAATPLSGSTIIAYGDVLFRRFIVTALADSEADFAVMVDTAWRDSRNRDRYADYVVAKTPTPNPATQSSSDAEANVFASPCVFDVVHDRNTDDIMGEWIGMLKLSPRGAEICNAIVAEVCVDTQSTTAKVAKGSHDEFRDMAWLIRQLVRRGHVVEVLCTSGNWLDCDTIADALDAGDFAS